ncbi:hypothetical protein F4604DRAFT_1767497, partial [Suillus subluteus]
TTATKTDYNICICDTPPDVLAEARVHIPFKHPLFVCSQIIARKKSTFNDLLKSDAARRPTAGHRRSPTSVIPMVQRPPPIIDPRQPYFLCLNKLLRFSPRANTLRLGQKDQHYDPLDVPATLPLPSPLSQGRLHLSLIISNIFPSSRQDTTSDHQPLKSHLAESSL